MSTTIVHSYQEVDGLQAIYIGTGTTPTASFVFESKEKAVAANEGVARKCNEAFILGTHMWGNSTAQTSTTFLEVIRSSNLSKEGEDRVLSYSAKTGVGTVGIPMQNVHELLDRLGKAMRASSPSLEVRSVTLYAVDEK